MDKLIHDGHHVTITNDGATVMRELQIQHPAARLLADISKAQDDEVRGRERESPEACVRERTRPSPRGARRGRVR